MFPCLQAELGDSLVLAQPCSRQLFVLNPVAALVWQAQRSNVPPEEIAGLLADQFGIPIARALTDVRQVIGQFGRMPALFEASGRFWPPQNKTAASTPEPAEFAWQADLVMAGVSVRLQVQDVSMAEQIAPVVAHLHGEGSPPRHILNVSGHSQDWAVFSDSCLCDVIDPGVVANVIHYLVDDVIPVTPEGELLGIGMSLCLKSGSWPVLEHHIPGLDTHPVIERFGLEVKFVTPPGPVARKPVRAELFLFPRYRPGCDPAVTPGYTLTYPNLETGLAQVRQLMNAHGK